MKGRRRGGLSLIWPALAALAALVPLVGAFSTTNVFYIRDLAIYFWPRHLWLKQSIREADWPLWDPYAGGGQSAVADALNQFFLLPITLVRLGLPDVPGFNFWVAAPFPAMAVGSWLWLRGYVSPAAALVGASIYSLAGPVVSTGTFPNLSWSVALIPWTLWAADHVIQWRSVRSIGVMAACVAMQALAGEPVTLAGTGALVTTYALVGSHGQKWAERLAGTIRVVGALFAGALLASVQLLPLMWAATRSARGSGGVDALLWSLRPLQVVEVFVPHVFGHPDDGLPTTMPWLMGMYDREPLFSSLYIGLGTIVLALIRGCDSQMRMKRTFWWAVAGTALIAALGASTPVYPALQTAVPILQSFRYAIKYIVFCVLALSVLAACGAEALLAHATSQRPMSRPVLPAVAISAVVAASAGLALAAALHPDSAVWFWQAVALLTHVDEPGEAAKWMLGRWPLFFGVTTLGLGLGLLLILVWRRHRWAMAAAVAFCGVASIDPAVVNRDLHPTMPAAAITPPEWLSVTRSHQRERVYVGGRVAQFLGPRAKDRIEIDAPERFSGDAELPVHQGNALLGTHLVYYPAAWRVRESISYDLAQLWPREYSMMLGKFRRSQREARLRFLGRTGVRYCFLDAPPYPGARPVVAPASITSPMALYECHRTPQRVYVTQAASIEPDVGRQLDLMFDERHDPFSIVLLEREAPAGAGRPGIGVAVPVASVVRETNTELVIAASTGSEGGYLNVLDSYDSFWTVAVDSRPAVLLRANGLFRAVRLTPGSHEVRFTYRPIPFYIGVGVSAAMAALLLLGCVVERRKRGAVSGRSSVALPQAAQ